MLKNWRCVFAKVVRLKGESQLKASELAKLAK